MIIRIITLCVREMHIANQANKVSIFFQNYSCWYEIHVKLINSFLLNSTNSKIKIQESSFIVSSQRNKINNKAIVQGNITKLLLTLTWQNVSRVFLSLFSFFNDVVPCVVCKNFLSKFFYTCMT